MSKKIEKTRFVRVDSDIPERLIVKDNQDDAGLTPLQTDIMSTLIRSQIPEIEKTNFIVSFAALKESDAPATVTRNEFMRRMKEMAAMQPGAGFYGEMPDSYEIIINTNQPVVKQVVEDATTSLEKEVAPIRADIEILNNHIESLRKEASEKKESMPDISDKESKVTELRNTESEVISSYAKTQPKVKQIIDLALLQSNLLKGESLNEFIKRSISLL